jgi:hypothetical protein
MKQAFEKHLMLNVWGTQIFFPHDFVEKHIKSF